MTPDPRRDAPQSANAYLKSLLWTGDWFARQTMAVGLFGMGVTTLVSAALEQAMHQVPAAALGFAIAAALFVAVALIGRRIGLSPVVTFSGLGLAALIASVVLSAISP